MRLEASSYPLTNSQHEIWLDQVLHAQLALYNLGASVRLAGPLDVQRFERAMSLLVRRHDNLRTMLLPPDGEGGTPRQVFRDASPAPARVELRDFSRESDPDAAAKDWMRQRLLEPFALYGEPLFRQDLIRVGPDGWYWFMQYHHLIADGWTFGVLIRSLGEIYTALGDGRDIELQAPSFADFIGKDAEYAQSPLYEKHRAYWLSKYAELPPRIFERARGVEAGAVMPTGCHSLVLPRETGERIAAFARAQGSTPFQVILGAMYVLSARTAQVDDLSIGLDVLNRSSAVFKATAGQFSGVSPVRLSFGTRLSFAELLAKIDRTLKQDYRAQRFPIGAINQALGLRGAGREQLFDLSISYMRQDHGARFGDAVVQRTDAITPPLQSPLNLYVCHFDSVGATDLEIEFIHNTAYLDTPAVQALAERLVRTLDQLLGDPDAPVNAFPLASEAERLQLAQWNGTAAAMPRSQCVHELFETFAACTPEAVALAWHDGACTYGELNAEANRIAHYLRDLGVGPETRVALCAAQGRALIASVLAILKAGGAYVPLDPAYPRERLMYLLADSDATVVLADAAGRAALGDTPAPCVALDGAELLWAGYSTANPAREATGLDASHLAYVIYTSGSTGSPKGVMVEHRNFFASTWARLQVYQRHARFLLLSSISFDSSVAGIFGTLASGGALLLPQREVLLSPPALRAAIRAWRATSLLCVPSLLQVLIDEATGDELATLEQVIVAGEACWPALVARVAERLPRVALYNEYGPTEASVWATVHRCDPSTDLLSVPIGRPIANCTVHLLDPLGHPVPIGATGEICIGGEGVARGYLNQPELTAERFVHDPFSETAGARLYRTADLARHLPDGSIEFLGRNDAQVKIRGYRVELGEIEARLLECPGVREAAVLAREDSRGGQRLVAYVTGDDGGEGDAPEAHALHAHLARLLPDYMVPAEYVALGAMPLTANGKLDRKALPTHGASVAGAYQPPVGAVESALSRFWAELLGVERVGRHDRFFALGGHSLLAMSLIERLRGAGLSVTVGDLFLDLPLAELAAKVGRTGNAFEVPANLIPAGSTLISPAMLPLVALSEAELQCIVDAVPGGAANIQDIYPLGPLQEGILFHHRLHTVGDPYLSQVAFGFDSRERLDAFLEAMQSVIERHDILRTAVLWEGLPEPVQVVWRSAWLAVEEVGLDPQAGSAIEQLRERFDLRHYRLDVRRAPMMRACIAHDAADGRWVMLWLFHHLMDDNTSLKRMLGEIQAHLLGQQHTLPAPLPFRNYVAQTRLGIAASEHEAFFRELLGDVDAPTLPFELGDVHADGSQVAQATGSVEPALAWRLRERARVLGVTTASLFHLAWAQVLGRVSGRDDVVFGTVLFGRMQGGEGMNRMLGMLINTLPMRVRLDQSSAQEAVRAAHALLARLLRHEHAPLALAQRCSGIAAPAPLFASLLNFRHGAQANETVQSLEGIELLGYLERTNLPLILTVDGNDEGYQLVAQVRAPVDPRRVFDFMHRALEALATTLENAPDTPLNALDVMPAAERAQLLVGWNTPLAAFPAGPCIHQLFEAQAARAPEAIALVFEDQQLSYAALNTRANKLARHLRRLGVRPDSRVAICMERSPDLVVAVLATLKAGGGYVPLDPAYPADRLAYMLRDSAPVALLTHAQVDAGVRASLRGPLNADTPVIDTTADAAAWARLGPRNIPVDGSSPRASHLAYVIYTSGSTGEPKGVMVEHANVTRLFDATRDWYGFGGDDVWTLFHSFSFDFSVWEIWGALLHGGRLVVVPHLVSRLPQEFHRLVVEQGVTVLNQTPSAFRQFITAQQQAGTPAHSLRAVIFGGEALELATLKPWYAQPGNARTRLVNMYGITETTVHVTWRPLEAADAERPGASPIGVRIPDLRIYILDAQGRPAPVGVVGEIHVGGAGVARGYLNRPALTAERFVHDPFSGTPDARMYRTADLGRWLPDGSIEFLGRNDSQVKIRGFRIELGEIEARLLEFGGVREAVVLAREDVPGDRRLVAYCVGDTGVTPERLRTHLGRSLPEYMVPAAYVLLDALPLTRNGKLDAKALPAPEGDAYAGRGYEAPVGETETALASIWAEVLHVERVGRRDNFFELGGHSLLAMGLIERMRQSGLHAQASALFAAPTLCGLAATVTTASDVLAVPANLIPAGSTLIAPAMLPLVTLSEAELQCIVDAVPGGAANIQDIYPLGPLQEGILFHHRLHAEGDVYLLQAMLGFDSRERLDAFLEAMQSVIERHDILRTAVLWEGLPEPVQVVWRSAWLAVEEVGLDPQAGSAIEQLRERFDLRHYRLDVRRAPMMRACIAHDAADGRWVMLWLFHHLMDDNTSLKRMLGEIQAHLLGQQHTLPAPLPFRNYVAQTRLGIAASEHEAFFRELLGDVDAPTLPFELGDVHADGSQVAQATGSVEPALAWRLRERARVLGVTTASLFHLAWAQVLGRVSGRDDVVFGTVLFGRMQGGEGMNRMLGMLINTLPMRVRLDQGSAQEAVRAAHTLLARLLRHEHAPLALAQRCSGIAAPAPLFASLLNFRHGAQANETVQSLDGIELLGYLERSGYPLMLSVDDLREGFSLGVQVRAPVDPQRVFDFMHRALEVLVSALEQAPDTPLAALDAMPPAERDRLLLEWNATADASVRAQCLHAMFEAQAARTPAAVAVAHNGDALSYAALNAQANRLARHLRSLGVGPDCRVALNLPRGTGLVAGLLAVLKAGGAYVPLDPDYPVQRLDFMLRDSAPLVLLTDASAPALAAPASTQVVDLRADAAAWAGLAGHDLAPDATGAQPEHLAYVIYTSGSAGVPKGVAMPHAPLANLVGWQLAQEAGRAPLRTLQFAALGFDVGFQEIFTALCSGAALDIVDNDVRLDPRRLFEHICAREVQRLYLPYIALQQLAEAIPDPCADPAPCRLLEVIIAGEQLRITPQIARFFGALPACRLLNHYGPAETHVTTAYALPADTAGWPALPPIGRPIANTRMYLLNARGQPVPVGVPGELHIAGASVARGYLNRPELTAERFLDDPFHGGRMYKTGDLGRWLASGELEFLGRNDFQVKIRGFRIEPGEIEVKLAQLPGVREAAVIAREDSPGDRRLVAYVVADDAIEAGELRDLLAGELPEYMVPAAFVQLHALPLTPNGKLDRKALPAPGAQAYAARAYEAPQDDVEATLATLWSELLNVEQAGRNDDFFALGGHSLLAVRLVSRLRQELGIELPLAQLFANPQLKALAAAIHGAARSELPSITRVARDTPLPLSFAQQRLWFLTQLDSQSRAYHIALGLRLEGELDRPALRRALDGIVARHETLRTRFVLEGSRPVQRIAPPDIGFLLREHDLRGHPDARTQAQALTESEADEAFDLTQGPLIRGRLLRLEDRSHVLLVTLHHIASDGWSLGVLMHELRALYGAFAQGLDNPLPALAIQYADYAVWQRRWLDGEILQRQSVYWQQRLHGAPALLELPTDRPRPLQHNHRGATLPVVLDAALTAGLKTLGQRHGTTLHMTLMAAWGALLGRLSGQDDVVVGTPVANRTRVEIEGLIGFFINTLAMRLDLGGSPGTAELLRRVKVEALAAQEHQDLPFEQVVELVNPVRSLAHSPIFQVSFTWQNNAPIDLSLPGLKLQPIDASQSFSKFDLWLSLGEAGDRIEGGIEYASALFDRLTIERFAGCFVQLLRAMAADTPLPVDRLDILGPTEARRLLVEWNATGVDYPNTQCVHELFEAQAAMTPQAVAVVQGDEALSYDELNTRANRLAHHLRDLGVGPDARVAICAERRPRLLVGVLAVLKAGGAFVPLDPAYPRERLAYLLADSDPTVVLLDAAGQKALQDIGYPSVLLDGDAHAFDAQPSDNPRRADVGLEPSHLAYVIYTSGSTGQPKGVMVEHRSVCNLTEAQIRSMDVEAASRVLQFSSISFDAFVFEVMVTLRQGACLVLGEPSVPLAGEVLLRAVRAHGVTHATLPSAVLAALPDDARLEGIATLVVAGEACPASVVDRFAPGRRFINAYGPTESTVCATLQVCVPADTAPGIGRPIANMAIYLLDAHRQPVPVGVAGELYIGGAGVARGYLNRPELTAERFLDDPFRGGRMYRTGDLARYRADGNLEFLGRNDFQVKVRGFRIELGEIEARLAQLPGVREAAVLAREDKPGDKRLVAYVVADVGTEGEALRAQLAASLPEHMVPAAYVLLDQMPLTPNGKTDRRALPAPDAQAYAVRSYEEPEGEVETTLAQLWAELLNVERIGRHDDFFALGGHSLLAVQLIERMRQAGLHADVRTLFVATSLASLAAQVGGDSGLVEVLPNAIPERCEHITPAMLPLVTLTQAQVDAIVRSVPGGAANVQDIYPLAPLQEGILFHHLLVPKGDVYLVPALFACADRARVDDFTGALQAVIDRHDILRTAMLWEGLPEPVQVVWRQAPLPVDELVLDAAEGDVGTQLRERFDPRHHRIDMRQAPLMRVAVAHDAPNGRWMVLLRLHHAVADHTALELIQHEVQAHLEGRAAELPAPLPFRNFVAQARLGVPKQEHEDFFRRMLGDLEEPTAPFGLSEVQGDGIAIRESRQRLDRELALALRRCAAASAVSVASLCHLAWALVLARTAGRDDVVFGTVLFGRMQGGEGSHRVLGLFINTLPLRVQVGTASAREGVQDVHRLLAQLIRHEHAPLALAQRCSGVAAPTPLFSSLFNYRYSADATHSPDAQPAAAWEGIDSLGAVERTNYAFTMSVDDLGEGLGLTAQVESSIDPDRICAFMREALQGLVEALTHAPELPLHRIGVLDAAERDQLLVGWNATQAAYPSTLCMHELVEVQAGATPEAVALVHGERRLSYRELDAQSNRLAHHLRTLGVGPDARVAVCVQRSERMVVALLAVLKAGGAYVPLDPAYPAERLAYMLQDSQPRVMLTDGPVPDGLLDSVDLPVLDLARDAALWAELPATPIATASIGLRPDHLAYIIYTSGSTGHPKGVMIEHRNAVNFIAWARSSFDPSELRHTVMSTSLNFDLAVYECWVPLASGGCVEVVADALALVHMPDVPASLVNTVPSAIKALLDEHAVPASVRTVNLAGEPLKRALVEQLFADTQVERVCNLYGPSETTTYSTWVSMPRESGFAPHVGRPVANTRIYLLDAHGQPVPIGVVGELYIAGDGVARGYLNRPELTAERFLQDPFAGGRMYRTGDLARYLPDGNIEFLGRNDFQVKVRGFRIELGEIEARLAQISGVREAAVLAREDTPGDKRLVAYVVANADVQVSELRAQLCGVLPEYMVPAAFVQLDALPLTPNGKLDRRALPAPDALAYAQQAYEPPEGETETALAALWSELLDLPRVGRHDDFFALGGHSLLAMRLLSRLRTDLGVELPLSQLFEHPQLSGQAQALGGVQRTALPAIQPASREQALPLSFAQQRLWFLTQLDAHSRAYHMPIGLQLTGPLDRIALQRALDRIVGRHEALRTAFVLEDGMPVQRIAAPDTGFALHVHDLRGHANAQAEVQALAAQEAGDAFELSTGPLIRGRLLVLGDAEHVLLITMHHIVSDGWSMGVLTRELSALYGAFAEGREDPLSPLPIQYADYAAWQRHWLEGEVLQRQGDYWKDRLAGAPALLELPADHPRPAQQDHRGAMVSFTLDAPLTTALKTLSQRHGTTLYMTLLAAWAALLARLSSQDDVVIGTPVANRTRAEVEGLIGFFINTLALRIDLGDSPSTVELLRRVKTETVEAQQHQDLPFEQVVEIVKPARSMAHTPLFQVMFSWQADAQGAIDLPGLAAQPLAAPIVLSKFDLTLHMGEAEGRIAGGLEYASALFEQATIERFASYLVSLLEAMVAEEERPISALPMLPPAEREQLLVRWNATGAEFPGGCMHELFEAQARRTPDAIAVVHGENRLRYAELDAQANRLAHHLRTLGVGPDARVAVCVQRSERMVVALLAVLKAGGAYVPLDPAYPVERLASMLQDSEPRVLISDGVLPDGLADGLQLPVLDLQADAAQWASLPSAPIPAASIGLQANHLAYVIYTSGSTGHPKGVMVEHRNLVNFLASMAREPGLAASDVLLAVTSLSFDIAGLELYLPLLRGATVVVAARDDTLDSVRLAALIRQHRVSVMQATPATWRTMLDEDWSSFGQPLKVLCGGEALPAALAQALLERAPLVCNLYGPTETTIWSTLQRQQHGQAPRIGRPIANTRTYLLDAHGQPVPLGVAGELYIAGGGVARGYLNRPGLTAERFLDDPFHGGRMYKTGDLARWLPDGTLAFLGRNDFQVKIRGFRIELGEIEARLAQIPGVREAAVMAREDSPGDKRLVAYVVADADAEVQAGTLRAQLSAALPEYMVPAAFVQLDALPLTPNGKLDRRALPAPDALAFAQRAYEPPEGETETVLAALWCDLLQLPRVGRHDDFFALGGHSLLAVRLVSRLRHDIGVELPLGALFERPQLHGLADAVLDAQLASFAAEDLEEALAQL
ncbi:MAG: non-ribosomal peptide synthase/polyketide synthase [Pseudomonadota bacterium]